MSKNPQTLYANCLNCYVKGLNYNVQTLDNISQTRLLLPPVVLADIYFKMSESEPLRQILMEELADLDMFIKLLKYASAKQSMLKCFQALICDGKPIAYELCNKYVNKTHEEFLKTDTKEVTKQDEYLSRINHGLRLGTFFSESGCLEESLSVLGTVLKLIQKLDKTQYSTVLLELSCLQKVLHAQAAYSCFKDAAQSSLLALNLIKCNSLGNSIPDNQVFNSLLANLYQEISVLHFCRSEYDLSYEWSLKALQYIKQNSPTKIIVDVLRQAAKSCVVKRRFQSASMLIKQAVTRARNAFGIYHQKYADVLLDYGFLLLNVDSIKNSVAVYEEALQIRKNIFGEKNIYVAIAHEDIAYALYVYEYSSGNFDDAKRHVVKAIEIMKELVPTNHLMLASAKRVQALILEEQALEVMASQHERVTSAAKLLEQSEELHQSALQLSLEAFGEVNVQTAKHYGNLGRLYQSMEKYEEAEKMHKKAIKIKTDLLGPYDYEVGLSIGHLASLYNYHMKKHREAEELYLKSIDISLRLFGETYSGLEYDYRGLCHVYEEIGDTDKYFEYANVLDDWRLLRAENDEGRRNLFVDVKEESPMDVVEEVTRKFFEMCSEPDVLAVS